MLEPAANTGVCNHRKPFRKSVATLFSAALVLAGLTGSTVPAAASAPEKAVTIEESPRQTSTVSATPQKLDTDDAPAETATTSAPVQAKPRQESTAKSEKKSETSSTPSATETATPEEEQEETEVEPEETEATITVRVGGNRSGANSLAGLAGVSLRLYTGGASGPASAVAEAWARCTSNSAGECSFTIPDTHPKTEDYEQGDNYDQQFWVVQESAPSGWYENPTVGLNSETPYQFRTGPALRAGKTYTSSSDFMRTKGSAGIWQNSRANPAATLSCKPGADIAVVLDRSGPVGNVPQLSAAAETMKKRLAGTNSTVTVIDASTTGGLGQVATGSYDLAIVVGTGGKASSFAQVEQTIGAANTAKASGTRILAVGIGPTSPANLRAIAGSQTSGSASYSGADVHTIGIGRLTMLLESVADQVACETTVQVTQQLTAYGQDKEVAGAGWAFTADVSQAAVTPQATQQTGKKGTVSYGLELASANPGATALTINSTLTDQQRADGWAPKDATCQINGTKVPAGKAAAELSIKPGDSVECTFHTVQTLDSGLEISKQAWDTDNIGGLAEAPELPRGASVPAGKTVTWTYQVTNTGDTPLDDVVVTDSQLPDDAIVCPTSTLGVGKSMTCTATGAVTADH